MMPQLLQQLSLLIFHLLRFLHITNVSSQTCLVEHLYSDRICHY